MTRLTTRAPRAIFPPDIIPPPGVGSLSVHALSGNAVLRKVIDLRFPPSLALSEDQTSLIVSGLLSEASYRTNRMFRLQDKTTESVLEGTYLMAFPCAESICGDVRVILQQKPLPVGSMYRVTGCCGGCSSGCGYLHQHRCCSDPRTHRTSAEVEFGCPMTSAKPASRGTPAPRYPKEYSESRDPKYDLPPWWPSPGG
jgi:hypothetical protein